MWLAISPQLAKHANRVESLTSGLETSVTARILGLLATVFLAVVVSDWLMRIMGRNP